MANNNDRFYFVVPSDDGTATLGCILQARYDPRVSIFDQLDRCMFVDKMPLNEMLETGTSLINGAVQSSRHFAEAVRLQKVEQLAANAIHQPASREELAKLSAFLDGVNLDPSATPMQVHEAMQVKEAADAAADADRQSGV